MKELMHVSMQDESLKSIKGFKELAPFVSELRDRLQDRFHYKLSVIFDVKPAQNEFVAKIGIPNGQTYSNGGAVKMDDILAIYKPGKSKMYAQFLGLPGVNNTHSLFPIFWHDFKAVHDLKSIFKHTVRDGRLKDMNLLPPATLLNILFSSAL